MCTMCTGLVKHGWHEEDGVQVYYPLLMETFLSAAAEACKKADSIQQEVRFYSPLGIPVSVKPGENVKGIEEKWYAELRDFCGPYEKEAHLRLC